MEGEFVLFVDGLGWGEVGFMIDEDGEHCPGG